MAPGQKYKLSVNRCLIDKNAAGNPRLFVDGFDNVELTMAQLADSICAGMAHCVQLSGQRRAANFLASDVACVDVDGGITIQDALDQPLVRDHAGLVYTTFSHRPEAHRFRIVFPLPRTILSAREMAAVQKSLSTRLLGDRAAVDAARIFYGNRDAQTWLLNREITPDVLEGLIAQSANATRKARNDVDGEASARVIADLRSQDVIRLVGGRMLPFAQITPHQPVFCPFHADERASAFSVSSRSGVIGIHCSACATTFWPKGGPEEFDFGSFEKAALAVLAKQRPAEDPGPLVKFFSPEDRAALTRCNLVISPDQPAPPQLTARLTLVRAPKGSGKTQAIKRLTEGARSVLLIGHRRSLLRNSCSRLTLHCYLDDGKGLEDAQGVACNYARYGICLDSILKIEATRKFDVVVLDESEQVLCHVLSETMERRNGGGRDRIFQHLRFLLGRADKVVALDADLGWVSLQTLERIMAESGTKADNSTCVWIHDAKPGVGKVIEVFSSKSQLVAELEGDIGAGKRCFVTSNFKGLVAHLDARLRDAYPDKRILLITADTSSYAPQQAFLSAPADQARNYDVVLTSPAVGTGVDISFPRGETVFDTVFGFCEPLINTHLDFDQQIGRVRHPKSIKVYVTPRRFHFETNEDAVKRDILEKSLFKNVLHDYRDDGTPRYLETDPLIELASLVLAAQRASKNSLLLNFIEHKRSQGYELKMAPDDEDAGSRGRDALTTGGRLDHADFQTRILAARTLQWHAFQGIRDSLESGATVTEEERFDYERTRIELFYRAPLTADLIAADRRGRLRKAVRLLQRVLVSAERRPAGNGFDRRQEVIPQERDRVWCLVELLRRTPILQQDEFSAEAIFERADLAGFASFVMQNRAVLETQLGIQMRGDVMDNPVQQLTAVLRLVGLKLRSDGKCKRKGQKIYRYRLDADRLQNLLRILGRRRVSDGWDFIYNLYGWEPDWPEPSPY